MSKTKTNDEFIIELREKNDQIIPQEPYINNHTKLLCLCRKCGYTWNVTPNSLLCGSGCPKCSGVKKRTNEEFVQELFLINPSIEPLEPYPGNNKIPVLCKCRVCNTEWRASPNNLLSKHHHCPNCSHIQRGEKRRKTNADFVKELSVISPTITPLDPYITSQRKIKCQCQRCGFVWSATPNNLLDKNARCPQCSKASTSIVEQIFLQSFSTIHDLSVLSRDKKAIGRELDIYVPTLKLAIEYGAWYWHKNKLKKDNEKQRLCKENGIHLITIFEGCPSQSIEELSGDFRLYEETINDEADYHTLKEIISGICSEYYLPYSVIVRSWDNIVREAIDVARRRSDEEFKQLVFSVNPSIKICDTYTRSSVKLLCVCSVCGHEWKANPTTLIQGRGCPKCARTTTGLKLRLTNDEFVALLAKKHPDIEPLDHYVTGIDYIRCKCSKCGNIWSVRARNLLNNNGCPQCSREKTAERQSKPIRCIETGIVYKSLADATKQTGAYGINKCAKGYQKTAGGYHWEYVE